LGQTQEVDEDLKIPSLAQSLHAVCAEALEKVPLVHAVHTVAPSCEVNVPALQLTQAIKLDAPVLTE